jgi:hypothetical protein
MWDLADRLTIFWIRVKWWLHGHNLIDNTVFSSVENA